jgi:putative DNA primase/helicase
LPTVNEPLHKLKQANVDVIEVDPWPEPGELPDGLPEVPALTIDMLPAGVRGHIADVAERMQCPTEFTAVAAVVAASSLIGRQLGIRPKRHDDWTVTPNLWGCIVGRPGVMKSPALKEMLRSIIEMEDRAAKAHEDALRAHEIAETLAGAQASVTKDRLKKLLKARKDDEAFEVAADAVPKRVSPERRRYIANDSTVEKLGEILAANPRGVLIFRDELSGWLRSLDKDGREADRAFYLEAWEGGGRFTYDRIGRGTIDIPACCVSMLGGIQPGVLSDYIAAAVRGGAGDDGLVQRFQLLVWPDVSRQWRNVDCVPAAKARDEYQAAMLRLDTLDAAALGAETPDEGGLPFLRFDDAAQDLFDTWRGGLELRLRSGELIPALESHLAKYRSLVPSLALIFDLLAGHKGPVGHASLLLALRWAEFLEAHAGRIYSVVLDADALAARRLAAKIRKREVSEAFTRRDIIRKGWSGLTTTEAIQGAINVLIELGWLREVRRTATGGRSSVAYIINPQLQPSGVSKAA